MFKIPHNQLVSSQQPKPECVRGEQVSVRWLGRISYADALAEQERANAAVQSGEGDEVLFLLEHEPVYTIGRTRDRSSLGSPAHLPHPAIETNRGGQATFHGPGQLVGYPIIDLSKRGKDLHFFLRSIEDGLIELCARLGIRGGRREGLTGVWVEDRKIASIGVGVRKWVTMHGFAMNAGKDLSGFAAITPCGIAGVRMTSLSLECGKDVGVREAADLAAEIFSGVFRNPGL